MFPGWGLEPHLGWGGDSFHIGIAYALWGAILGSFLTVVIERLPRMIQAWDIPNAEQPEPFNLWFPGSHCPSCRNPIPWYANIPLISYAMLRRQCLGCHAPIPIRYFLVESVTMVLCTWYAYKWGHSIPAVLACIGSAMLIALVVIDFRTYLLPDELTLPLLWTGLLANAQWSVFCDPSQAIWGAALGYLILWSLYWIYKGLTGKEGLGYGDFKLLGALGAWFGWMALPPLILMAASMGCVVGLLRMVRGVHRWDQPLAFGPYLAGAGLALWIIPWSAQYVWA